MSDLPNFTSSAKGLARNPLGIIALFIALIYGVAALTLAINGSLLPSERLPLVWFLVLFPVLVLLTFGWLVSRHHQKLYAPGDYKSDEGFLEGVQVRARHTAELQVQQQNLKTRIRETIVDASKDEATLGGRVDDLYERISKDVDQATSITIDASRFLGNADAIFTYPLAVFEDFNQLTNEVYFKISDAVAAFEYGYTWVLRNRDTGKIIQSARMLRREAPGHAVPDSRSLSEVGIQAGATLDVEIPKIPIATRKP